VKGDVLKLIMWFSQSSRYLFRIDWGGYFKPNRIRKWTCKFKRAIYCTCNYNWRHYTWNVTNNNRPLDVTFYNGTSKLLRLWNKDCRSVFVTLDKGQPEVSIHCCNWTWLIKGLNSRRNHGHDAVPTRMYSSACGYTAGSTTLNSRHCRLEQVVQESNFI
jgi:hypothetical protein